MKTLSLSLLAAAALCSLSAQAADSAANPAYVVDGSGAVVHDASGSCWHNGSWSAATASAPCDGVSSPAVTLAPAPLVAQAVPAPAPLAAPAVLVVPAPLVTKVSFSGDALFDFDKSVLRPKSRVLLDDLVRQLVGTRSDSVRVTGNTDRLGSAAYNQKLSQQRANAVKDYLVGKNVQADSIVATGLGETQPVSTAADCVGTKPTAKLIACLQPDRRVDVEMTGTRTTAAAQ